MLVFSWMMSAKRIVNTCVYYILQSIDYWVFFQSIFRICFDKRSITVSLTSFQWLIVDINIIHSRFFFLFSNWTCLKKNFCKILDFELLCGFLFLMWCWTTNHMEQKKDFETLPLLIRVRKKITVFSLFFFSSSN